MATRTNWGLAISANKTTFSRGNDARSEARWWAAINELVGGELIEDVGYQMQAFRVTASGFTIADQLWQILILRTVERLQVDESVFVDSCDLAKELFLSQHVSEQFIDDKLDEMKNLGLVDVHDTFDGRSTQIVGRGRSALRRTNGIAFSEPDMAGERE